MALIQCHECAKQISDTATSCPNCGALIKRPPTNAPPAIPTPATTSALLKYGAALLALVVIVGLAVAYYFNKEADKLRVEQQLQQQSDIAEQLRQKRKIDEQIAEKKRIEDSKPEMPVAISYRKAMTGRGLVVTFRSVSPRHLAVAVTLTNPSLNQQKQYRIDLAPGQASELGHLEGWTFASGDKIEIRHNEYRPSNLVIP